ncbi:argininosuccinate synthase domain-containing protein [Enterovibrio norvegicus]|uniref:argininosuccinate synthase n=1 Tax=Enterovibrio norvegicus TaxID=188144 RepID=A0A2N7L8R1_9GAMM|nr:argininosuccinate synthase domain-containing protein [Enterovibrio norvegicus]PMN90673.1 hypothetical protein BCT23_04085 [Enterovibrio norvegicus]
MTNNLQGKKIGVFASGGLTAWTVAKYAKEKGADVSIYWADVGQYDEPKIGLFFAEMETLGIDVFKLDLQKQVAIFAADMLKFNACYEGGYWNSTGALRYILVKNISNMMKLHKLDCYSHGCVGGGNDQKRFSQYSKAFIPEIEEYLAWKDAEFVARFKNRHDMVAYLINAEVSPALVGKDTESTDSCLIGTSYESTVLETLDFDYSDTPALMSVAPWKVTTESTQASIRYVAGKAVAINELPVSELQALRSANEIGGGNGISLRAVIENRVQDTKCRGVYESPGMDLLAVGLQSLRQVYFSKEQGIAFSKLSTQAGQFIYRGQYTTEQAQNIVSELETLTSTLSGTVTLKLYRGNILCIKVCELEQAAHDLHQRRFADGGHVWSNADA